MVNSLNAAYGHGHRSGYIARGYGMGKRHAATRTAPEWMPTRLHRFMWRQGFRNGSSFPSLLSQLSRIFVGE